MSRIVTLLNEQMLQIKMLVLAALMSHYGWEQNEAGQWKKGKAAREFRIPTDTLRVKRADLFERKFCSNDKIIELFTKGEVNNEFVSNFKNSTLPQDKFYVIIGIQLQSASGAAAAGIDTLNFGTITENELLNGLIEYEINGKSELEREPIASKFINQDDVPNFFRFPKPLVWEPNQNMTLRLKLPAAFDTAAVTPENKWIEAKLIGYMLEK